MSDHALFCSNTEVVPAGASDALLKRTAANTGWEFKTAAQLGLSPTLLQSVFTEQTTDTTTASATFVTLLTQTITISAGSILLIEVTASFSNTAANNNMDIQLVIDGTAVRGCGTRSLVVNQATSTAIVYRKTGLAVGAHTRLVQWRTPGGGTARCRPVTTVNEHASIMVQEVTV
jgi:hypothetical protein